MADIGKQLEDRVKGAMQREPDVCCDRQYDIQTRFKTLTVGWDFTVYRRPLMLYLECKAVGGNTLHLASGIRPSQWEQLPPKAEKPGVLAGVLVWFHDHDTTVFVPITELVRLRESGAKSLNVRHLTEAAIADEIRFMYVHGQKKRKFFDYDMKTTLDEMTARLDWLRRED